jgi:hypothetical protein
MALVCLVSLVRLARLRVTATWKRTLWCWVLALLGAASALGAAAHGLAWSEAARAALWHPLYLLLGLSVTLFLAGGIYELRGDASVRRVLPPAVGIGLGFFLLVELLVGMISKERLVPTKRSLVSRPAARTFSHKQAPWLSPESVEKPSRTRRN